MEEKFVHPPNGEGWDCKMSEKLVDLHQEVSTIKNQQLILSEKVDMKFDFLTEYFKESLDRQDRNIDRIAILAEETGRRNDLLEQNMDFRFKEFELKQENREQANEIKKLSNTDKFKVWWADSTNLPSKLVLMFGGVLALALAGHFKILDQALQLLTK